MLFSEYQTLLDKMSLHAEQDLAELKGHPIHSWLERLKRSAEAKHVTDCARFQDFKRMYPAANAEPTIRQMRDLRATDRFVQSAIHELENKPNNAQFAIAQAGFRLRSKYSRQMFVVKGGDGKSRIAASLVFLLLLDPDITTVHLVFSSEALLDRDRAHLQDLLAK